MKRFWIAALLIAGTLPALSQTPPSPGSIEAHPTWPQSTTDALKTVDGTISALYAAISGPAGQKRDWNAFRSLFLPDARLVVTRVAGVANATKTDAVILSVDDYVNRVSTRFETSGFFERGIASRKEEYGVITHVWTTYESRHKTDDPTPFARGINSVELLKANGRYYIVQVMWDSERPNNEIPKEYLPK
ncbi:hypothetical protein [Granulicella tundricola]|uniref:SnoaL-like domain-containing protein n=1 Tax=Granulicella tundricola (strain ATCC BAA-1859 / DSM 23138 / MP5ACTX9) TaxID=1198114 RepID=E8WZH7_GRATM|nr:hypothetical protein [Granulicella tundricola]ADW68865.1 hypothetical protein AciX9_1818 [Granulicella tundricola MP5ACTX9]